MRSSVDLEQVRAALRRMSRDNLLIVAGRALEIVPRAKVRALVGDMVRLDEPSESKRGSARLLDEVRKFHDASLRGEYYESFGVNSKNFMKKSGGTEAFISTFGELIEKCVRAAVKGPRPPVREAFELLFSLLRRIDDDLDSVIFFADEAGSWQVGVDWSAACPAYFQCLAESARPEDFAREVERSILDLPGGQWTRTLAAARRVASAEQKAALRRLPARRRPR